MAVYSYIHVIIILAAGYSILKLSHVFKYRIIRFSGQELFFSCTVAGMVVFIVGYVISNFTVHFLPDLKPLLVTISGDINITYGIVGWLISILLTLLIINNIYSNEYSISRFIEEQNDGIESVLQKALVNAKPVCLTLSTGKIYIGMVSRSFFSPVENRSFTVVPLYSGYREENTQQLIIVNEYVKLLESYKETEDESKIENLELAIPLSAIVSVNIFDEDIYQSIRGITG